VILEEPENSIKEAISELAAKRLLKNNGNRYAYIEPIRPKPVRIRERTRSRKVCDINYQNYENNFIQKVIEYFCADVETSKAALLLNDRQNNIINFYGDFRKKIYEQQQKLLEVRFFKTPQMPSSREYLGTNIYLYCFSKQVFVSTENLKSDIPAQMHTKKEIAQIKMINCLLRRRFENSSNLHYVEHRSAEYIWRKDKKYTDLIKELSILIKNTAEERTGERCF
jgi:hypothetical protein